MAFIEFKGLVRAINNLASAIRGERRPTGVHDRVLRELPKGVTVTRADPNRRVFRQALEREVAGMGLSPQDAKRRVAQLMKDKYDPHWRADHHRAVPASSPDGSTR